MASERHPLGFALESLLSRLHCRHPNNHFTVFGRLNPKRQNCIEAQRRRGKACVKQAWDKICANNSDKSRLWLAEIGDRMARVDGFVSGICLESHDGSLPPHQRRLRHTHVCLTIQGAGENSASEFDRKVIMVYFLNKIPILQVSLLFVLNLLYILDKAHSKQA